MDRPRVCACGCRVSLATKRPQARYASDRCRKRDHMRRARGARQPLVVIPCAGCGTFMLYDPAKANRRRYHRECADLVRSVRKNRHKRTSDLARSMGWAPPVDD